MALQSPEMIFNGYFEVYPVPLVNPGNFYLGFKSKGTGKLYAFLPEPTGTGNIRTGGDGTFVAINPETGEKEQFSASEIVVYQAATAFAQQPADGEAQV